MKRITDKAFVYVPSFSTDLKARFKEIIRTQKKLAELQAKHPVVTQIKRKESGK